MTRTNATYQRLEQHFTSLSHFEHVNALAEWDLAAMMPNGGSQARHEALATLSGHIHDLRSASWLSDAILEAKQGPLTLEQRANLNEMQRQHQQASLVPTALVQAKTRAGLQCEQAWRQQRKNNDWLGFKPNLSEVIYLTQQEATIRSEALGISLYDSLLDKFEPGISALQIEQWFAPLRQQLPELIQLVLAKQAGEPQHVPQGHYPIAAQEQLSHTVMQTIGFDFNHGRLDVSSHPFTGGVPTDVRLTTRFDEQDFTSALMGTVHETGHALYEMGLPAAWAGQPAGQPRSMAVHESQSLFCEMQLGRGQGFLNLILADINQHLGGQFDLASLTNMYTRVRAGKIRVDADEVTYPCHILLRFDAEKALIDGRLAVADLPDFWSSNMQSLLAINTDGDYRNGCMQDIHWTLGELGYFPSYSLGAMLAAQLRYAMEQHLGTLDNVIANQGLAPIFSWLAQHVWQQGSLRSTTELIQHACGDTLSAQYLLKHLRQRYL
ncbi:carboxypeptidase M32 [Shewanella sp. NIFS-20-20]|uniref:carboxypeptidase M32 n=1 Tax=Shewanella sp. NIFS-20-20 TaxID=2853806 RepID=UPI001C493DDF|nr:carboxypeptidase M32 [Shewanella sp. NIFS-20-20]MBV7314489.1 carboxypeptidase M32 [Shewanella sp. NIFS-20-20]